MIDKNGLELKDSELLPRFMPLLGPFNFRILTTDLVMKII